MTAPQLFLQRLKEINQTDFESLQAEFGGQLIYFPKKGIEIPVDPVLAKHIYDEFDGRNIDLLGLRYNLSAPTIYHILKAGNPGAAVSGIPANPLESPTTDPQTAATLPAPPVAAPDAAAPAQSPSSSSLGTPDMADSARPPTRDADAAALVPAPESGQSAD